MNLRPAQRTDDDAIWEIFRAVIAPGDTYFFDPTMPRDAALNYWFGAGNIVFVAEHDGAVVGTYLLRRNNPDLAGHIANAAFMVSPTARRLGVGKEMGEHCLAEAKRQGYLAMQFNFVVSTNAPAVTLWQSLGFRIIATVPSAFRHSQLGFVDAHIMFRTLD